MNGVVAIVGAAHMPVGSLVGSRLGDEAFEMKRRNAKQRLASSRIGGGRGVAICVAR